MRKIIFIIIISIMLISCGQKEITLPDTQVSVNFDREKGQHVVVLNGERYVELTEEPNQYWQIDSEADFHYVGTVERNKDKYDIALTEDGNAMDYYNAKWLLFEVAEWYLLGERFELPAFTADNVSRIEIVQDKGKEEILKTVNSVELIESLMKGFYNDENNIPFEEYHEALEKGQVGDFGDITVYANDYEWLQYYSGISFIGENCYAGTYDGSYRFIYIPKEVLAEVFDMPLSEMNGEDYWWTQEE